MNNIKALEVAKQCNHICNNTFCRDDANNIVASTIQSALDEATADLRTQLAERDAQLAAVIETARKAWRYWDTDQDSKVGKCLAAICGCNGIIPEIDEAFKATRQPTQDKE